MKNFSLILCVLILIFLTACSGKKDVKEEVKNEVKKEVIDETKQLKTVIGEIMMVGNEPFAHLAITNEKVTYKLKGEENILAELNNAQGQRYEITYKVLLEDNFIEIVKATKLKTQED